VAQYQFNSSTDAAYFHTMTISAAATVSPRPCKIPSQDLGRHDCPHRNIACDHPAAWFGQIRSILREIAPFLQCKFCYTVAITARRREDDNLLNVSRLF
jgi:hypothetical protein